MPWNTSAILHSCGKIEALLNHTQLPSSPYYTRTQTHTPNSNFGNDICTNHAYWEQMKNADSCTSWAIKYWRGWTGAGSKNHKSSRHNWQLFLLNVMAMETGSLHSNILRQHSHGMQDTQSQIFGTTEYIIQRMFCSDFYHLKARTW